MSRETSKITPKLSETGSATASAKDAKAEDPKAEDSMAEDISTGRVQFDDRGNAIWEWSLPTGAYGREVSPQQLKKLEHPALSIAEDAPTPFDGIKANPLGIKKGYNPYDSGKLDKAEKARKKDLRKLSEWLKLRKQAERVKGEEED
jgi:hypothetical protein